MAGSDDKGEGGGADGQIGISVEQWQRLHSREFSDQIYDRVWTRILKIFGTVNAVALIGAGIWIWGPIQTQITQQATERVRTELAGRLTADMQQSLQAHARRIAEETVTSRIQDDIRNPESQIARSIQEQTRALLTQGIVRAAVAAEHERDFLDPAHAAEHRGVSFRLLRNLDEARARAALLRELQRRLAGSDKPEESDRVLVQALRSLTDPPATASTEQRPRLTQLRDLAGMVFAVLDRTRNAEDPSSNLLLEAAGDWFRGLDSAEDVADWLSGRAYGARALPGRSSVAWELLLADGRRPALVVLGDFVRRGSVAEVQGAFRQLANRPWPDLDPAEAERLLAEVVLRVPAGALGHPGLTPALLEARWAMQRSAAHGTPGLQFAWSSWGRSIRDSGFTPWRQAIETFERGMASRRAPGQPGQGLATLAAPAAPELPLGADAALAYWPALAGRVLSAVPEARRAAFIALLLPAEVAGEAPTRERRLAVLAMALGLSQTLSREVAEALAEPVIAALAAHPRLDTDPLLGVALQRVLAVARPESCGAVLAQRRPGTKLEFSTAMLLACALSAPGERARLADWLDALPPPEGHRLLSLLLLATPRGDFDWPMGEQETARARRLVELLHRLEAESAAGETGPEIRRIVSILRQRGRGFATALDAEIERSGRFVLFPAATDLPAGGLPEWAAAAWWEGAMRAAAEAGGSVATVTLPAEGELRLALACAADRNIYLRLTPAPRPAGAARPQRETYSVLVVEPAKPARLFAPAADRVLRADGNRERRPGVEALVASAGCDGDRLLRLRAPPGTAAVIAWERPPEEARFAESFEERASVPALRPGQPVIVVLEREQRAHFPLMLDPARRYVIRTRNLETGTDTRLALLGQDGAELEADDDGGDQAEALSSRVTTEDLESGGIAALLAGTYDDRGGKFQLLIEDAGPAATAEPIATGAAVRPSLQAGGRVHFRLTLRAGQRVTIATDRLDRGVDTVVSVMGPDGRRAVDDDGGQGAASLLDFQAARDGEHRLVVRNIGQAAGAFDLTLREP